VPIPIELESGLCEEIVLGRVLAEERAGRVPEWRHESEEVYRIASPLERDRAFRNLALGSFAKTGAAKVLHALLAEFEPRFPGVSRAVFQRANRPAQEGTELHVSGTERVVRTEVGVTRMLEPASLETFLRSEWTHVADMLDPSFGYGPDELEQAGETPFDRRMIRERYRALWTSSVTGRLAREGKAPEGAESHRRAEVYRVYAKLPETARAACFEAVWSGPRPTHAQLMALAASPSAALAHFAPGTSMEATSLRMPGDSCPLCHFPAWKWGDPAAMADRTRVALTGDFPTWKAEEGLCDRCDELYRARTGCW